MRRLPLRRPSPSIVVLAFAVLLLLSGTAQAATGGNFLLGKSNTATTVSTLTNSKGTALSLKSLAGTPPLAVDNTVQVPNLNASLLGGTPASGFVQGGGAVHGSRATVLLFLDGPVIQGPDSKLEGYCNNNNQVGVRVAATTTSSIVATWWTKDGYGGPTTLTSPSEADVTGWQSSTYLATVQVIGASTITTYTVSMWPDTTNSNCRFAAEVVVNNA